MNTSNDGLSIKNIIKASLSINNGDLERLFLCKYARLGMILINRIKKTSLSYDLDVFYVKNLWVI
jgi:hypothetical protein